MLTAKFVDPNMNWLTELLRSIDPPRDVEGNQWFPDAKRLMLTKLEKKRISGELTKWCSTNERLVIKFDGDVLNLTWSEIAHLYTIAHATE